MLNLILGRAGTGKTETVRHMLVDRARAGGKNLYLIVPEQYSFETEKTILRMAGPRYAAQIQVLSFTRLAEAAFLRRGLAVGLLIGPLALLQLRRTAKRLPGGGAGLADTLAARRPGSGFHLQPLAIAVVNSLLGTARPPAFRGGLRHGSSSWCWLSRRRGEQFDRIESADCRSGVR